MLTIYQYGEGGGKWYDVLWDNITILHNIKNITSILEAAKKSNTKYKIIQAL